jgi:hypothetical protein
LPSSHTRAADQNKNLINACAATAEELSATRRLTLVLETENKMLTERVGAEKKITAVLTELNETRKGETEALRSALSAKNDTIAAKDAVIAAQDKLAETLRGKKTSPWKRLGDILIGAAVFAVLK